MKFLLSVIAVCLVLITAKLYIPNLQADIDGLSRYDFAYNSGFTKAVREVAEDVVEDFEKKYEEVKAIEDKEMHEFHYTLPDIMKHMINTQCSVNGRRIICPYSDQSNLLKWLRENQ
tara:strand:- start:750 stop:1100 length:351 start_codon:yes stop_codon:yes gene_type:complete